MNPKEDIQELLQSVEKHITSSAKTKKFKITESSESKIRTGKPTDLYQRILDNIDKYSYL